MALQVRRGTNAERLSITPLAGELIYVTDTKQLYVGDGTTVGGTTTIVGTIDSLLADTTPQLGGDLDLNNYNITGTGDINITGNITATGTITATGNINLGDGAGDDVISLNGVISGNLLPQTDITWNIGAPTFQFKEAWINQLNVENQITANRINGSLLADDSTIIFDAVTGTLNANALVGTFNGDVVGSVFGDDSTPIVDAINKTLTGDLITPTFGRVEITNPGSVGNGLNGGPGEVNLDLYSNDNRSLLNLRRRTTDDLTGDVNAIYGTVTFGRDDANGVKTTAIMFGRETSLYFGTSAAGVFNAASQFMVWKDYKLGVGLTTPTEAVDVNGNGKFSGTVTSGGFVQFGSYTDVEIGGVTPANGMVYYNTTDNKFRGYQNGNWINLDDGSTA